MCQIFEPPCTYASLCALHVCYIHMSLLYDYLLGYSEVYLLTVCCTADICELQTNIKTHIPYYAFSNLFLSDLVIRSVTNLILDGAKNYLHKVLLQFSQQSLGSSKRNLPAYSVMRK